MSTIRDAILEALTREWMTTPELIARLSASINPLSAAAMLSRLAAYGIIEREAIRTPTQPILCRWRAREPDVRPTPSLAEQWAAFKALAR